MIAPREPAPRPPVGFRPFIPVVVKLEAAIEQEGRCPDCGERLGELRGIQWDHWPALQLRVWDPVKRDTIPAANDPKYIRGRHIRCHDDKTNGPKTKAFAQGDKTDIARAKSGAQTQEAFRQRILAKEPGKPRQKSGKIPSRPFPKGHRPLRGRR